MRSIISRRFLRCLWQLITALGLVMLAIFVILGIQTLYNYLSGNAVEGFTTVILLLLFIGSTLSISLGIIVIMWPKYTMRSRAAPCMWWKRPYDGGVR